MKSNTWKMKKCQKSHYNRNKLVAESSLFELGRHMADIKLFKTQSKTLMHIKVNYINQKQVIEVDIHKKGEMIKIHKSQATD